MHDRNDKKFEKIPKILVLGLATSRLNLSSWQLVNRFVAFSYFSDLSLKNVCLFPNFIHFLFILTLIYYDLCFISSFGYLRQLLDLTVL